MKKKSFIPKIIGLTILTSFTFVSCNFSSIIQDVKSDNSNYTITKKLLDFKEKGMLDNFYASSRSLDLSDENLKDVQFFIENSDKCITETLSQEGGKENIDLINCIYEEKTIGEVYDAMKEVSQDLADEYEKSLIDLTGSEVVEDSRSITCVEDIKDIKLCFDNESTSSSRELVEGTYTWGTVAGYIGCSAAAIAGFLCYRFGFFPWVKIAGLIAAGVGVVGMGVFIVVWQSSPEWKIVQNFCSAIYETYSVILEKYSNMPIEYQRQFFIDNVEKELYQYLDKQNVYHQNYEELCKYMEQVFGLSSSLQDSIKSFGDYLFNYEDLRSKTISVVVCTLGVIGAFMYSGLQTQVLAFLESIKSLFPSCIQIIGNGVMFAFTW